MEKEFVTVSEKQTAVRIQNTKINAIRTKDIIKKGVRVYKDGKCGTGGAIGEISEDIITNQAIKNLDTGISYPYDLQSGLTMYKDLKRSHVYEKDLMEISENILEALRTEFSGFDFSESINFSEISVSFNNTKNLDLIYKDAFFDIGLVIKEKKSANLFDGYLGYTGRKFETKKFLQMSREVLKAYNTPATLPEGEKIPVISMGMSSLKMFLNKSLNGESYASGSSILSKKLGEKIFCEKITIDQCRDSEKQFTPFFDMEGVVLKGYSTPLIKDGMLANVYTDKRTADKYNLTHTGAASGSYDDIPRIGYVPLRIKTDSTDIKKALGGKMAIFEIISQGGDFTSDGNFAAPVQLSFLYDGEKLIGRLPEFTMRSNIYKMLGEDYIGTFDNPGIYAGDNIQLFSSYMEIVKG